MAKQISKNNKKTIHLSEGVIEKFYDYIHNNQEVCDIHLTDKEKKELFLYIFEISIRDRKHEIIKTIDKRFTGQSLSFESKILYILDVGIEEFGKYKANDNIFAAKYHNILKTQTEDAIKYTVEQMQEKGANVVELKAILSALETAKKMLDKGNGEVSTSLPINAYQKFFWDTFVKDHNILTDVIFTIINEVVIARAKEMLNNKMLNDDGTEWVVNKDYDIPIEVIYNEENIANEVQFKHLEKVIFIEKKDIKTQLNNVITKLIADGKITQNIVN